MTKKMETEVKVGLFVTVGIGLIMAAILALGGEQSFFTRHNRYRSHFDRVDGLIVGSKVILGGVQVGTVESIKLDKMTRKIEATFSIDKNASDWIRADSSVEVATQGVLGDKYLSINIGSDTQPEVANGSEIPNRPSKDLSQFLSKSDQLMVSLNTIAISLEHILRDFESNNRSDIFFKEMTVTARNFSQLSSKLLEQADHIQLKSVVGHINDILAKIDDGTGTIGALVNDPGLYEQLRALLGGINRNRIMRNLVRQSVKQGEEAPENK